MTKTDQELIDAYLDGRLDPEQGQALQRLLENDAEARAFLRLRAAMDERLTELAVAAPVDPQQPAAARLPWVLAAAALIVAALAISPRLFKSEPMEPAVPEREVLAPAVAILNVVESAAIPSGELRPGCLEFEQGMVRVDFFSGVRMLLRGPADIEIRSPTEVFISQGEASCFVSEIGRGFRVLTADGEVIDLGTAFGIRVQQDRASEVHVFEGEVSVRPTNASEATSLTAEQAVWLDADLRSTAYARDGFPSVAGIANRARARYVSWLTHSASLSADPDVLLHCTFEGQQSGDSELRNQATSDLRSSHGAIIGGRWGTGRWPMKSSLQFGSTNDRVLFKTPGGYRQLTMLVWVRVDALPNKHQTLLLTEPPNRWRLHGNPSVEERVAAMDRRAPGDAYAMRWTVMRGGNGSLSFLWDEDGEVKGAGHGLPKFVPPDGQGQWTCLAVVYDGAAGTLRSFVNGELSFEQPAKYRGPVHLDFMEMGNLSLESGLDNFHYRFYGAFDEVLVAKRAMTASEIREIYEIGAP